MVVGGATMSICLVVHVDHVQAIGEALWRVQFWYDLTERAQEGKLALDTPKFNAPFCCQQRTAVTFACTLDSFDSFATTCTSKVGAGALKA